MTCFIVISGANSHNINKLRQLFYVTGISRVADDMYVLVPWFQCGRLTVEVGHAFSSVSVTLYHSELDCKLFGTRFAIT